MSNLFLQQGFYARAVGILPSLGPDWGEVSAILNKYGGTMLLPGAGGNRVFNFQPANYRESTGQTLAAVDQQVGLVLDAAQQPGPELAPALIPSEWEVTGADATHIVTWTGSGVRYQSDTTSPVLRVRKFGVIQASKYYEVIAQITGYVSGGLAIDIGGRRFSIPSTGNGTYRRVVDALNIDTAITILRDTANVDLVLSSLSVRELPGTHASQATSGFQPFLRDTGGVQSWQFDGVDDRIILSSTPFQITDNFWAVCAYKNIKAAGDAKLLSLRNTTNTNPLIELAIESRNPIIQFRDNTGGLQKASASAVPANVSAVVSMQKAATTGKLRVDGVQAAPDLPLGLGTMTLNNAVVGASATGTVSFFLQGDIHGLAFGKGAIADGELQTLERFMASLQGRSL